MPEPDRHDVFISYESAEQEAVGELAGALRARGLLPWLYAWDLPVGHSWSEAVEHVLAAVPAVIVAVGRHELRSFVLAEAEAAVRQFDKRKAPVIPVLLPGAPDASALPLFLRLFPWMDLRSGIAGRDFERLVSAIACAPPGAQPRDLAALRPRAPFAGHEYMNLSVFSGRRAQRAMLSAWLRDGKETVFVLNAGAGMGKSALAWVWLRVDVLGQSVDGAVVPPLRDDGAALDPHDRPQGVMRWSFDDDARHLEVEPPFHAFLRHALAYAAGAELDQTMSAPELLERLLPMLESRKLLFVLDGLERELNSFEKNVDSPDSIRRGQSWRECADATAQKFLRRMASTSMMSRVLVCTRIPPKSVESDNGSPLPCCRREELAELNVTEAARLIGSLDVAGLVQSPAEIAALHQRVGGNPLALNLVVGQIRIDLQARGGRVRLSDYGSSTLSDEDDVERTFGWWYKSLPRPYQEILKLIAAFRNPVADDALSALLAGAPNGGAESGRRELVRVGIVSRLAAEHQSHSAAEYQLHPFLRDYIRRQAHDWQGLHRRLGDYWIGRLGVTLERKLPIRNRVASGKIDRPDRKTLMSFAELYHHLLHDGERRTEACVLFITHLWGPICYTESDLGLLGDLLADAFGNALVSVSALGPETTEPEAFLLNQFANAHRMGGSAVEGVRLHRLVVDWDQRRGARDAQAIRQEILGLGEAQIGDYRAAAEDLRAALEASRKLEGTGGFGNGNRAACLRDIGRLSIRTGDFVQAQIALQEGASLATSGEARRYLTPILAQRCWALLRGGGGGDEALALAERALHADEGDYEAARHRVEALAAMGEAGASTGDIGLALRAGQEALDLSCRLSQFELVTQATLALGRSHFEAREFDKAQELADDGRRLAWVGRHIGLEADAHLLLAKIGQRTGHLDDMRKHAELARDRSAQRFDVHGQLLENDLEPGGYDQVTRSQAEQLLAT